MKFAYESNKLKSQRKSLTDHIVTTTATKATSTPTHDNENKERRKKKHSNYLHIIWIHSTLCSGTSRSHSDSNVVAHKFCLQLLCSHILSLPGSHQFSFFRSTKYEIIFGEKRNRKPNRQPQSVEIRPTNGPFVIKWWPIYLATADRRFHLHINHLVGGRNSIRSKFERGNFFFPSNKQKRSWNTDTHAHKNRPAIDVVQ